MEEGHTGRERERKILRSREERREGGREGGRNGGRNGGREGGGNGGREGGTEGGRNGGRSRNINNTEIRHKCISKSDRRNRHD